MKRRTTILVLAASLALVACGKKDDNNVTVNNASTNNTSTNNTATNNTATNNTSTNNTSTNNTSTNNTSTNNTSTNNMTTGPTPTCDDYCDAVTTNCSGADQQYSSRDECIDYCENVSGWEAGVAGATSGNSIGCRLYHGGAPAAGEPATHCVHAGPSGGDVCGSWCDNYCALALGNCTGANELYADDAACQAACAGFNDTGTAGDPQYNTVQCRIYHAGAPAASDPGLHCPHSGETPSAFCLRLPTDFTFRNDAPSAYTRADRMGMPAVSTALLANKPAYNDANPSDDAAGTFVTEIVTSLTGLHAALDDDLTGATLTPCSMADNDADGLPDCVGQEIAAGAPTVAGLVLPDTLKVDPTAAAGFPNGRRLADTVMDVTLAIILLDMTVHTPAALVGTNPTENDLGVEGAFLTTFPYLHPPHTP